MSRYRQNPILQAISIREISRMLSALAADCQLHDVSRLLDLSSYAANDYVMKGASIQANRMVTCLPELETFHGYAIKPWLKHITTHSDIAGNFLTVLQLDITALEVVPEGMTSLYRELVMWPHKGDQTFQDVERLAEEADVDSFHIINATDSDYRKWWHIREDWTSQVIFRKEKPGRAAYDAQNDAEFLSSVYDIVRNQAIDAYMNVKTIGEPRLDKIARIIDGELLEFTRLIFPLTLSDENRLLAVVTQHERLGKTV